MVFTRYSLLKSKILQSSHRIVNGGDGELIALLMYGIYGVNSGDDCTSVGFSNRCGFRSALLTPLKRLINNVIGCFAIRHACNRAKRIRFFTRARTERIVVSQRFGKTYKLKIQGFKLFSKLSGRLNLNYMPKGIPKHNWLMWLTRTTAVNSRWRVFFVARAKKIGKERRRVARLWIALGSRIFFFKKGQNSRMGKGTGSFHTTRRMIKNGALLLAVGGWNRNTLSLFRSYARARIGSRLVSSYYKGSRRVVGTYPIKGFVKPLRLFTLSATKRRRATSRYKIKAIRISYTEHAAMFTYKGMLRVRRKVAHYKRVSLFPLSKTYTLLDGLRFFARLKRPGKKRKYGRTCASRTLKYFTRFFIYINKFQHVGCDASIVIPSIKDIAKRGLLSRTN